MFQAPKLTDAGKTLYYRNMTGARIVFTTIQLGNGTISGPISAMTAMVSTVVTIDATVQNHAEQYADVSGRFSNADLSEGFYWREIGVFVADPDYPDDRSRDILYCYQNAYDTADFIPVASVETVEKNITIPLIVGDASAVSCVLSGSQIVASKSELEDHKADENAHAAAFEKLRTKLDEKQDAITAEGILKGGRDGSGKRTVTVAVPGADYQKPTQELPEGDTMVLTDMIPFFAGSAGQNKKITLRKLKEVLGVQTASISVTTCAGAAVTCTDGETTLTGVGSTKFQLPEDTGTWTVTAALGGHQVSTTVEVSGASPYNVDLMITSSIAITKAPTKTTYNTGDAFNSAGLEVAATYADGTTEDVTSNCTFSPTVMESDTTAVTITYRRAGLTVTATQAVTVLELSSIAVTTPPTKTKYYIGESFDSTGMEVQATMSNGSKKYVTGWTYSPADALSKTNTTITISYTENGITKTCTQAITIRTLSSISVTTPPTKTAYKYGERFEGTGMAITAKYTDNATRVVTGWSYSPTGALGLNNTAITITYTEGGITKTCTQAISVSNYLSSISVTTPPTKNTYFTGEAFDGAGMVVTATMANGTTKVVAGYACSPAIMAADTSEVTVSYTENGVTVTTTAQVSITNVNTSMATNPWSTIRAVSDAGKAANYWSIGDSKEIVINGQVGKVQISDLSISAFIIGFDHNKEFEGNNRIHFQIGKVNGVLTGLVDDSYYGKYSSIQGESFSMTNSNTNATGWRGSHMRTLILGSDCSNANEPVANTLLAALPEDLRAVMKATTKYSDNVGYGNESVKNVTSTTDFLPLLAEFEYHGYRAYANKAEQNYQAQYDYYKAGNSKVHYKHSDISTAAIAWCRSTRTDHTAIYCSVSADGNAEYSIAAHSVAIAPCFFV